MWRMRRKEEGQRHPVVRVPTFSTDESTSVCDLAVIAGSGSSKRSWLGSSGGRDTRVQNRPGTGDQPGPLFWCLVSLDCRGVPTCRELGCCSARVV